MVIQACAETGVMTDRVWNLRERLRSAKARVCAERSRLYTEAWRRSDGEPVDIRWARAYENYLQRRTIVIRDEELIVGSETKYVLGASPDIFHDAEPALVLRNEEFVMRGETERGNIYDEDRRSILKDLDYWTGKSVQCWIRKAWREVFGEKLQRAEDSRVIVMFRGRAVAASPPDYRRVLAIGLRGIIAEAESEMRQLTFSRPDDVERYNFLRAVTIVLGAVITFARRHAALARELAAVESNPVRRRELEEIAAVCDRVPEFPAETFREAVQSYWFIYLCAHMEASTNAGRVDQYLYPLYRQDRENGQLSTVQAGELLALLWIKLNELTQFQDQFQKELSQGEVFQYVTIGGFDAAGNDASNELTHLILDVAREVKLSRPPVALVYHPHQSEDLLIKAIETNLVVGGGIPAFLNGAVSETNLLHHGFALEDARDSCYMGCVHPYPPGSGMLVSCNINPHKMFELALNNGVDPKTGEQLGPATGDLRTFTDIEEIVDAFKAQYVYWIDVLCNTARLTLLTKKEHARAPFHSALTPGCLENGRDILSGGWKYRQFEVSYNARGLQNIANSIIAIRKLVFEDKKVGVDELLEVLHGNFEGREELRQQLMGAPKWGNDDDEVDGLYAQLWAWTSSICENSPMQPWVDAPVIVRRGGATSHYFVGKTCGAFPDGRKAYDPMGDGNISPVAGTDLKGPTAVMNSASKLDQGLSLSNLFNMKFPPHLLKTDENKRKLLALIKTYFDRGGYHIQFNMIGKDILLDAKAHPEKYRDLVVRIAGFSAYFVDLVPAVQDDIIARTEHSL